MDCKTTSELMMKYFDKEINIEQEKLLFAHMEECEECSLEFGALKDTFLMLEDVEMEDAPLGLEIKVIADIKKQKQRESGIKKWVTFGAVAAIILVGWAGLAGLVVYTPVMTTINECLSIFWYCLKSIVEFAGSILYSALVFGSKSLVIGRALSVVVSAVIDTYSIVIIAMVLSMLIILRVYGFMFKSIRR